MFGLRRKKFEPHDGFKSEAEERYNIKGIISDNPLPEDVLYQANRCGYKSIYSWFRASTYLELTGKYGSKHGVRENEMVTCIVENNGVIKELTADNLYNNALKSIMDMNR